MTSIAKLIEVLRDEEKTRLPAAARAALLEMADQIETLARRIVTLDTKIVATVKADDAARRLTTNQGVGPIIAATVRATIHDPTAFKTGRDLAAWLGLTPRAHSSGGKERLGRISKQGNKRLRTLIIVGATSVLSRARRGARLPGWVVSLLARRPYKVAAVALANKIARTIWALLVKGGTYPGAGAHGEGIERRHSGVPTPGSSGKVLTRDEPKGRYLDADQTVCCNAPSRARL